MNVTITTQVSDTLAQQLEQLNDRLPDILQRGVWALVAESTTAIHDEEAIIAILASQPSPEQILALRPSPELQTRVSTLLACSKEHTLSRSEER